MFNLDTAIDYIDATIRNHCDGKTELRCYLLATPEGFVQVAELREDKAAEPHVQVRGQGITQADAIIRLACAIREESDIGA